MVAPPGFEPGSRAPKARRIDHYPTGLTSILWFQLLKFAAPNLLKTDPQEAQGTRLEQVCVSLAYLYQSRFWAM